MAAEAVAKKLEDLKIGAHDHLGRRIREILYEGPDFIVYRTDLMVDVFLGGDANRNEQLRLLHLQLVTEIADLNKVIMRLRDWAFVTGGPPESDRSRWPIRIQIEHEFAAHLANGLLGNTEDAKASLKALLTSVRKQVRRRARLWHLMASLSLVIAFIIWFFWSEGFGSDGNLGPLSQKAQVILALLSGAIGALFSTASRLQTINVDPTFPPSMHLIHAGQRVLVGSMGALIIFFAVRSGIFADLLQPQNGGGNTNGEESTDMFHADWIFFVGVLAGFSERLVPNLLDSKADSIGAGDE